MSESFGNLPSGAKSIETFKLFIPDASLDGFSQLLRLSKIPQATWESTQEDRRYGVTMAWLTSAKDRWLNGFDWRSCEDHINEFPQFKAAINDEGEDYEVHFAALFSKKTDAVPVIAMHGWPGSFLEFLPLMSLIAKDYTPETLPYHFIAPSLPGFTLSSGPGPSKPLTVIRATNILNALMVNLGFGSGYMATGGDIGSALARMLAVKHHRCKAMHINYCAIVTAPAEVPVATLSEEDRGFVQRGQDFLTKGSAYALEHGSRPSTISLVLSSNPLALLAWIGEKFLTWTDEDPALDTILEAVSLYWFTETISRCFYPYRQSMDGERPGHDNPAMRVKNKPFGYSLFPKEINPTPREWAATTGDLSWFRQHESGGHFAAMEKPKEMKKDIEDFLQHVQERGITFTP